MQCSGFIYALSVADAWIRTGTYRRILVVGQEIQSTGMDVSTRGRNTAVIFADGAGAVVLGPTDDPSRGILSFDLHSEGEHAELLWVDVPGSMYHPRISEEQIREGRHFLQMDGKEVFRHAVGNITDPDQANAILTAGRADLVALARPHLVDPMWTLRAAAMANYRDQWVPPPYLGGMAQMARLFEREAEMKAAELKA